MTAAPAMGPAALQERWWAEVLHEIPAALELRRELHREPRVSGDEADTADRVQAALGTGMTEVAGTGRVGRVGPPAGPAIMLRGELDALHVRERTGAPFASTNGHMHACGHDVHLAALAAVVRAAGRVDLPLGLVPVLQPREETYPSGALDVVRSGVLEERGVVAAVGAHVHPGVPVGSVATGAGVVNAAADEIEIVLTGQGGHGAYPHDSSDPVAVLGHLLLALPDVVRRTVSPMRPATLSVGHVLAGGPSANVRPAEARILATIRTTDAADRRAIVERVRSVVEHHAAAGGIEAGVTLTAGEPVLRNAPELVERADSWLRSLGMEPTEPMRSLGADDFSYYGEIVPSLMAFVGVRSVGTDVAHPLHHACFLPEDRAVQDVAAALVAGYLGAVEAVGDANPADGEEGRVAR